MWSHSSDRLSNRSRMRLLTVIPSRVWSMSPGAVVSKEGEIAATEVELQEAQVWLTPLGRKSGTGTGSAQVVSLDPGDLTSLGDGQVAVESSRGLVRIGKLRARHYRGW